jgi:hypothetical protein
MTKHHAVVLPQACEEQEASATGQVHQLDASFQAAVADIMGPTPSPQLAAAIQRQQQLCEDQVRHPGGGCQAVVADASPHGPGVLPRPLCTMDSPCSDACSTLLQHPSFGSMVP